MTKLAGHHARVLAGGYNLSAVSQSINPAETHDQHDVTCFSEAGHNVINGQRMIALTHKGLFDPAGAHAALSLSSVTDVIITVMVGENTAPVVGNIAFLFNNRTSSYKVSSETSSAIPFEAEYAASRDNAGGWGKILVPSTTITNTTTGTAVDNGASSANGAIATLHVLTAAAADTYVVKIEHSADNNTWADLVTFALDGSVIGAEWGTATGTVNRYLRYSATRTGSAGNNFQLAVAIARL